jgi:hypothetical protein
VDAMKINKNDIDSSIIEKVNQFDKIVDNFTEEDKSGFLAYNGENFYIRRTSDVSLRRVSSEEELEKLKAHLYEEGGLLKNSFRTDMNLSSQSSERFKPLISKGIEETLFKFTSRVVLNKKHKDSIYVLTEKGFLLSYNTNDKTSDFRVDVITEIKSNFAIKDVSIYDFLAIEVVEEGVFLSTRLDGVFFYNIAEKKMELKFPESDVVLINYLGNNMFVLGMDRIDNNIAFYNISGMRVEVSNNLKRKSFQMPYLADSRNGDLFIVGRPYSLDTTRDILHYWSKDLAEISYNGKDGKVFPGFDNKTYKPLYINLTDKYLYISGLKQNKDLFVWQYDLKELQKPYKEFLFNRFSFEDLSFVEMNDEYFVASENNKIYFMDANVSIKKNILLNEKVVGVFNINKDNFIYLSDDKIILVTIPEYSGDEIKLSIYDQENHCNNIDIYVKSKTGKEKISFFDGETLEQIAPYYFAIYKTDIIIKILGSLSKKIIMKMIIPNESEVEGIVVSPNRLFMK